MSGTVNVTTDHDLRIPLIWKDDVGVVSAPTSGTTATSDNTAVISAIDVAADDQSIVLRTAGAGTCNVLVKNGNISDTIQVIVGAPAASTLTVDSPDAAMITKGTPA